MSNTLEHLLAHHGDFESFRQAMIDTGPGRFGPIWWGVWDQHVQPSEQGHVVDLGTGPGLLLEQLRARHPQLRLTGVELQPAMLPDARAAAARTGAELLECDLSQPLALPDGCAEVVTAVMVFHELAFPPPLLREAARLLQPGGRLVLYDWVKRPLTRYLREEELTPGRLDHFREHCLFSSEDLEFLAHRAGLETLERVDRRSGHFSILVARKPEDSP